MCFGWDPVMLRARFCLHIIVLADYGGPCAIKRSISIICIWTVTEGCDMKNAVGDQLLAFTNGRQYSTILADPPWRFTNRTGKMAPEHRRLSRYGTLTAKEIADLPVEAVALPTAHLYLWVPNALLSEGLQVMAAWGFQYKTNIVWHKLRKDGGSDGRGVGFYFRNVTELLLFGIRGKNARTLAPGRRQVNYIGTRKREHSRKPDEQYEIIEACSPGPYLELFARGERRGWHVWGNQADDGYAPAWPTYSHHSAASGSMPRDLPRPHPPR